MGEAVGICQHRPIKYNRLVEMIADRTEKDNICFCHQSLEYVEEVGKRKQKVGAPGE